MTDRLRAALRTQARACADLDSPFMTRLCGLLADRLAPGTPLTDRLFDWPGEIGPAGASVPLRLAGALHALARAGRGGLDRVYPPLAVDDATLWASVAAALESEAAFIGRFLDSPPQTNEVRRAAVLIAAALWLAGRHPLPLVLSELGASAGLNLSFDAFGLIADGQRRGPAKPALMLVPDWRGPPPPDGTLQVAERRGVDLSPIDPATGADRLLAYLWADQPDRLTLTQAALALPAPPVDRADAADWLDSRLARRWPGHLHLIFHTIAWQYFPPATQARARARIEAAGDRATEKAPLAWLAMEADGARPGAAITLRLWPGNLSLDLGRVDFHGRWVDWQAPA